MGGKGASVGNGAMAGSGAGIALLGSIEEAALAELTTIFTVRFASVGIGAIPGSGDMAGKGVDVGKTRTGCGDERGSGCFSWASSRPIKFQPPTNPVTLSAPNAILAEPVNFLDLRLWRELGFIYFYS
jgi:hypothetical protein